MYFYTQLINILSYKYSLFLLLFIGVGKLSFSQTNVYDTVITGAVVYNGDTLEAKTLDLIQINGKLTPAQLEALAKWTRLRNAVYITYPYAKRAGGLMNEMNVLLATIPEKEKRREYIKSREKDLKKEFTIPLTNLSVYQGKILMKLINRETGNNCYEIIKEFKGGFMARFYQTVAFFFNSSLKQPYNAESEDYEIEKIVQDVRRMYGYTNG